MKEKFIDRAFDAKSLALIDRVNAIVEDYTRQGYRLTLRQIYYQLVSQNVIRNEKTAYGNLGDLVSNGRLAGLIDWDAIEDRNRIPQEVRGLNNVAEALQEAAEEFHLKKWDNQPNYVVVMIEKAALAGVIGPVCRRWQVPFHVNRGYSSSSALYELGKTLQNRRARGQNAVVIYAAGDFDPSGVHMTQDVADRLVQFSQGDVTVARVALTWKQIQKYNPPPNPVKFNDARAKDYVSKYGRECWEVDALEPGVLARLTEKAILQYLDEPKWEAACEEEDKGKDMLQTLAERYSTTPPSNR